MLSQFLIPAVALLGLVSAQTSTDCNPLKSTNCKANPALGTDHLFNFTEAPNGQIWETTAGKVTYDAEKGATFTINKQGDSPTLRTKFYFFFGRTEVWLKAAPGKGIVSSMMWLSDDLDEVDLEFLGGNNTHGSSNFFGKGRLDYQNSKWHLMPKGLQDDYHNYTTTWTKDQIDWWIDGELTRTVKAVDANNTANFPQTPMRLSLGIWAGGDPTLPEGTREWAGGDTDYKGCPYTMYVKQVQVTDYSSGKEYVYGDQSGSYESIKIVAGNSTAVENINKKPEELKDTDQSVSDKWNGLPQNTKTAVYAGGIGAAGLGLTALAFFYIRQRRRGAGEAKLADEAANAERDELMLHSNGESMTQQGHEYRSNSRGWARL